MDQTTRTIVFGIVAVLAISMAFATGMWTQPRDPDQFSDEGTPFFPDFTDPFEARTIEVAVYNDETETTDKFEVTYQDGVWRIPTHYNYPADGQDQLSKTATSVIGITRDSLQSESREDHEELGVIDPLDDNLTSGKGCGTRVRLIGENEKLLVDYIIGLQPNPEVNRYYIRREDEDRTYLAKLDIQLSTKFTDWIEPDLLQVERNSIVELYVNDYSIVETPLPDGGLEIGLEPKENVVLTRESGGFQWSLEGIDDATERVKTGVVNAMLTALDDLKIVGVRPKPEILQSILRGEPAEGGPLAQRQMESDMASKGYYLLRSEPGLLSNEGALIVGTDEGVSYQLLVGNVFVGDQNEIEIGGSGTDEDASAGGEADLTEEAADSAEGEASGDDAAAPDAEAPAEELAPGETRSRYLFILASFDEELLGPKPEPPVMPTPPGEAAAPADDATDAAEPDQSNDEEAATGAEEAAEAATEAEAVDEPSEEAVDEASEEAAEATEEATESAPEAEAPQCDDPAVTEEPAGDEPATETDPAADEEPATDAAATDDPATEATVDDAAATDAAATDDADPATEEAAPAVPTAEELQAAYDTAMREYETALAQYEQDLKDYNDRIAAGQKKVDELHDRFAEWYYVIPADVFDDLDVSRAELVEPKPADDTAGGTGTPDFSLPGLPALPDGLPELPELPMSDGAGDEADPMPETPETDAAEATETTEETAPESAEEPAAGEETVEESATSEATPETPEAEGSQSSESGETPAAEPDSTGEAPTMP